MLNNKILAMIIGCILILNIVGWYALYQNNKEIKDLNIQVDRLLKKGDSGIVLSKNNNSDGVKNKIKTTVFGGKVINVVKDSVTFKVDFFEGTTFEEFQGEKKVLISDNTVFKQRTVNQLGDNYFSADEKEIGVNNITTGSDIEVEVIINDNFPEFITAKTITVLKY